MFMGLAEQIVLVKSIPPTDDFMYYSAKAQELTSIHILTVGRIKKREMERKKKSKAKSKQIFFSVFQIQVS